MATRDEDYLLDVHGAPVSYDQLQRIQRDVLLLYHQSKDDGCLGAEYRSWGVIFELPYWRYIGLEARPDAERPGGCIISNEDRELVRHGCMAATIDMLLDHCWRADDYIAERLGECESALGKHRPSEGDETRLNAVARATLELARRGPSPGNQPDRLEQHVFEGGRWAFECVVLGYYRRIAAP